MEKELSQVKSNCIKVVLFGPESTVCTINIDSRPPSVATNVNLIK